MTDRLIKIPTALAVVAVAVVAPIISYQHAYELVRSHGESDVTARLLPERLPDDRADWCRPRALGVRACCAPPDRWCGFLSRPALRGRIPLLSCCAATTTGCPVPPWPPLAQ